MTSLLRWLAIGVMRFAGHAVMEACLRSLMLAEVNLVNVRDWNLGLGKALAAVMLQWMTRLDGAVG